MLGPIGAAKPALSDLVQKCVLPNGLAYVHFPRAVVLSALVRVSKGIMGLIDFYGSNAIGTCSSIGMNLFHHGTIRSFNDGGASTGMNVKELVQIFLHKRLDILFRVRAPSPEGAPNMAT